MLDLFPTPSVRIQRVLADDARRGTDVLKLLKERLNGHEHYYPDIKSWTSVKVIPELKTGKRVAYVGFHGDIPILAAVLKHGERAKFCHLSIESGFRDNKLGHLMFSLMAAEVRNFATEIHFTLPEGLWEREKGFFQTFGFESSKLASSQYRLFEEELRCSAPFAHVWSRVVSQLPTLLTSTAIAGFRVNDGVVLSMHERHATAVIQGRKTVELRKRFADRWVGRDASVYAAGGSGSLLGTVTIRDVTKGTPEELWERFGNRMGCTRTEFDSYAGDRSCLYAIHLSHPRPYEAPVPLSQLSHLVGETIRPPQSHSAHSASDLWGKALSLAAILHSKGESLPLGA